MFHCVSWFSFDSFKFPSPLCFLFPLKCKWSSIVWWWFCFVVETSCYKSYKKKEKEHKKNTSKCQKESKEKIKRKWQKKYTRITTIIWVWEHYFDAFYCCSSFYLTAHYLYLIYYKTLAGANLNLIFPLLAKTYIKKWKKKSLKNVKKWKKWKIAKVEAWIHVFGLAVSEKSNFSAVF